MLQGPVEDGLVHVDIALPDYKLALFLENAHHRQGETADSNHSQSDGSSLNGYADLLVLSGSHSTSLLAAAVALPGCSVHKMHDHVINTDDCNIISLLSGYCYAL